MAVQAVEQLGEIDDPVCAFLVSVLDHVADLVADRLGGVEDDVLEAVRVDRLRRWEQLVASVTAGQASEIVGFGRARVERQLAEDVHPRDVGRGIVEEIGLACRTSPTVAGRRLGSARAWWSDLPQTYRSLTAGEVGVAVAEAVVVETRHLDGPTRREVDARLHAAHLASLGVKEAAALARRYAYEADREAYVARGRHERKHRRVGLRPAPDTMSVLSGYLPVEQGVACLAALRRHTDGVVAGGDDRSRDQIMADTLVERLTGQAAAADVGVEIQLVVPVELAADPDSPRTATVTGAGPLPGGLVHEILDASRGTKRVRRLRASASGRLIGIDPRRRFTGALADLVVARDQTCRVAFCGAPIRHLDHIQRHADGGSTTLANGRGLCARHNLVQEQPGWSAAVVDDGLGHRSHTVRIASPTGHVYVAEAPDPP
jgi:uncharacterized protein DUF222